jgi:nucleoside-diphosphate-sugar epimerase
VIFVRKSETLNKKLSMQKIFLTGGTGFIGKGLALKLAREGHTVNCLVRTPAKAKDLFNHPGIHVVPGDLTDLEVLRKGLRGCQQVYHLAALASPWHPNPKSFFEVNVDATQQLVRLAGEAGVDRIVVTSTAGVLGAAESDELLDETHYPEKELDTDYERSKFQSEAVIRELVAEGHPVVIVNPSRVYGPGLLSESNSVTKIISGYKRGTWRFIPGNGESIGNYVFVDDVIQGHQLAMEHGRIGERYILGGENVSFNGLFTLLGALTGRRLKMVHIPLPLMMGVARFMQWRADRFNIRPAITPPFVRKYHRNWPLSIGKAKSELGYQPLSMEEGIQRTLSWLESSK